MQQRSKVDRNLNEGCFMAGIHGQCHVTTNLKCKKEHLVMNEPQKRFPRWLLKSHCLYAILICHFGSNLCAAWFLRIITHSWHSIWDWSIDLVMSWLKSNNGLLLCLDSKLISIAHFSPAIKVNIVTSLNRSPVFSSKQFWYSTKWNRSEKM